MGLEEDDNEDEDYVDPMDGVDPQDVQFECLNDPVLLNITDRLLTYENNDLLAGYANVCLACKGDKRVLEYEHIVAKDKTCPECNGTSVVSGT